MKLPNDCPFSETSLEQSREIEMYRTDCCRAGASVHLTDGAPLCRARQSELEVYRFLWQSSFNGDAAVHIARKSGSVELHSYRLRSRVSFRVLPTSAALSFDDWQKLQCALKTSDFWALDTTDERFGLDGAWWFIEGRRGDVYHSITRWSPRGAVRDLGRLFFALAGSPLADVELY